MMNRKQLKQYNFVIQQLVGREMKRKYTHSILGIIWSVLQPLLMMLVMTFVFSYMFKRTIQYYPLFYLTGYLLWNLFSGATNQAISSIRDNRGLIMKTVLPKQIFPTARVCTALVNFLYSLIAYVIMLTAFRVPVTWRIVCAPAVIGLLVIFTLGISYILSSLYVFFGDIKYLYSVFLTLWMFTSAIFYPLTSLSPQMQEIVARNPMYNYIVCVRNCVLYQTLPSAAEWLRCILWAAAAFFIGKYIFEKTQVKMMQRMEK